MDSIDTKSKINSVAAIPTGGTRKSSSGSGEDEGVSFASILSGSGFAGMKSGGGMQQGLEDSLGGALDRNPDEAPERAPEQATKHDYNDDAHEQPMDDGYYNKANNTHDNPNDSQDDVSRESVHTQSTTSDHSDDYSDTHNEPTSSDAEHAPKETVAQEGNSTNTDEPQEAQTEETASETSAAPTNKGDANGGATVEAINELSQNQTLPEQAAVAASGQAKDVLGRANAESGLNTAAVAIGAEKTAKPQSAQQNGGEKTGNQEKAGQNLNQAMQSDAKQEKSKTTLNPATNTTAKPQQDQSQQAAQNKIETQPREISNAAKQAAEISRAIGINKDVSVNVSVQSEKDTLISRPGASISLAADANKSNGGLNNTTAQSLQNQSTNNQMSQQNGTQNQNAQNIALAGQQAQAAGRQSGASVANNAPSTTSSVQSTSTISGDSGTLNSSSQVGESLNARNVNAAAKTNALANNPAAAKQPAAEQVSVQITKAIKVGADRISIQLRPAALGRIDIQMEMGADGRVSAIITADNKDTLDLLQRDQRSLERALQNSGMQTDSGSLSFNLRGQNEGSAGDALAENNANAQENIEDEEEPLDALLSSEFKQNNKAVDDGRIDIHA